VTPLERAAIDAARRLFWAWPKLRSPLDVEWPSREAMEALRAALLALDAAPTQRHDGIPGSWQRTMECGACHKVWTEAKCQDCGAYAVHPMAAPTQRGGACPRRCSHPNWVECDASCRVPTVEPAPPQPTERSGK
jgi:hypothetical protein